MLVVMGPVLGVSVTDLYAAAFGPGFLLAGIYIVYLLVRCTSIRSSARRCRWRSGVHSHEDRAVGSAWSASCR